MESSRDWNRENWGDKNRRRKRKKERNEKRRTEKEEEKTKKRLIEVKKIAGEWKIWNKKKKVAKSEKEAKKLVSLRFHKQIHVFRKQASERMLIKNMWDHIIEAKKGFVPRKKKIYLLSREERVKVCEFIEE